MAVVEVLEVSHLDSKQLWGGKIEAPNSGSESEVYAIDVRGWVLARSAPAIAVEMVCQGAILRTVPIDIRRADVAASYPDVSGAEDCGFESALGVLGLPPGFELVVRVILQDERRIPLAVIRGRHQPLRSGFQPRLVPLMLTSLGRSGGTWLMRLLAEHARVVTHRRYPYETRSARYWMHMLKVLSEPADLNQSSHPDNFHTSTSWIGHNPFYSTQFTPGQRLLQWLGRDYPEQLAEFCQHSIERYYLQVAGSQNQTDPLYFLEKHSPDRIQWLIWELYPQAREVVLVRDFRDMVCSILAFNAKRGYAGFGRENANSDEEYIAKLRLSALRLLQSWQSRAATVHLLRYEDLILRPSQALSALLDYLDLDRTPSIIEGMARRASVETPESQHHRTARDPKTSIGRWRRELDASLQAVCRQSFGGLLTEFGYDEAVD